VIDISNTSNWEQTYEETLTFDVAPVFPNFTLPIQLTSQLIFIQVSTVNQKETWHLAGWVNQVVNLNLLGINSNTFAFSQRLLLGGNLILFPQTFSSYSLTFSFPNWFATTVISIWEYTGDDVVDAESALSQISQVTGDLTTIAQNISQILQVIQALSALIGSS
jgi:hypothetical protein